MDVVEMVLGGRVNKSLVTLIQQSGGHAVGLCGKDSDTILARQMVEKDIGFVGEVTRVRADLIKTLVIDGYIPVLASVASNGAGQALNVNADTAAGEVAAALQAEKLILMTDVPGILHDRNNPESIYRELTLRQATQLVGEGIIAGGMIPKVGSCCALCRYIESTKCWYIRAKCSPSYRYVFVISSALLCNALPCRWTAAFDRCPRE